MTTARRAMPPLCLAIDWVAEEISADRAIRALNESGIGKGSRRRRGRSVVQRDDRTNYPIAVWSIPEHLYKKGDGGLPIRARGLYTRSVKNDCTGKEEERVVARGYDKFFNVGELEGWGALGGHLKGPFEISVKENGCIIFVAALTPRDLLVTSKHSLQSDHARKGKEWLAKHLRQAGRKEYELAKDLYENRLTVVLELADDDFEEHILPYTGDDRGLYMHGLNWNTRDLRTAPHATVHSFAGKYGFHQVEVIKKETLAETREFTDKVKKTGHWRGRPIEGFVVRCRTVRSPPEGLRNPPESEYCGEAAGDYSGCGSPAAVESSSGIESESTPKSPTPDKEQQATPNFLNFMFKVKFDEPYLLFREFREVTKRILGGKPYKTKFPLTRHYAAWVEDKRKEQPGFFDGYLNNKGIIKARREFMENYQPKEVGKARTGEDLSRGPEPSPDITGKTFRILIVPIATIGVGKTTLGRALVSLLGVGHIQNDDISKLKGKPREFHRRIIKEFQTKRVVFADRNNHLSFHRKELIRVVREAYPDVRVVCFHWTWTEEQLNELIERSSARILRRGERHKTLTPLKTPNWRSIIRKFTTERDQLDTGTHADSGIDSVIDLDAMEDTSVNLKKALKELTDIIGCEMPDVQSIEVVMESILAKDDASFTQATGKEGNMGDIPLFYGVQLREDVSGLLEATALKTKSETKAVQGHRASEDYLPPTLDLALLYLNRLTRLPKGKNQHHVTLLYIGGPRRRLRMSVEEQRTVSELAPLIQARLNEEVEVTMDRVLWNNEVMAIPISLPRGVPCASKYPHVTVCTFRGDIKPFQANIFLVNVMENKGREYCEWRFPKPVTLKGNIVAFQ